MEKLPTAIFLLGPTASGKTGLAVEIFKRLRCEIISVDSAQIYRDMDTGTAKPDHDTQTLAPHHLVDIIEPTQSYSAARFREDALKLMQQITGRGNLPLLVGGTMLYFRALEQGLNDLPQADPGIRLVIDAMAEKTGWRALHKELARLDPATAERLDPNDSQRIQRALEVCYLTGQPLSKLLNRKPPERLPYHVIRMALIPSNRKELHRRIAQRFDAMLENGLIEEVRWLRENYELRLSMPSMRCVGYRQVWQYLNGDYDLAALREKGIAATRQLAKRQLTWLRGMDDIVEFDCLEKNLARGVLAYVKDRLAESTY